MTDCVVYAFRVLSIVDAREHASKHKVAAKKTLAKDADVEMADGTTPGPSIQSQIDKAVSAGLKKLTAASKVSLTPGYNNRSHTNKSSSAGQGRQGQEEESVDFLHQEGFGAPEALRSARRPQAAPRNERWQVYFEDEEDFRKGQGEGPGELTSPKNLNVTHFRYDLPSSYPDWLLTIPYPTAISYIHLNTPIEILLAAQFRSSVHISPGVSLPKEIQNQLSVGMKYMFHNPRNTDLILSAWEDFEERLRWRLFFTFTEGDNTLYDPDYEVPHERKKSAPTFPGYIEQGIRMGRVFVKNTIRKIPAEEDRGTFNSLAPHPRLIEKFMSENNYIITPTDKNLGIAVSERTWIIEKCEELLSDKRNYEIIHPVTMGALINAKCKKMEVIAELAELALPNGTQIGAFMRHKITPKGEKHTVARFYGIPKIHKEPVKMRPIIPCHSVVQGPAAKYVSKTLKPIIALAPTIIHGSKDLAIKLSRLELLPRRQYYIVTGDVVAYYPNIPIQHCLDIIGEFWLEHYSDPRPEEESLQADHEGYIFRLCLEVANRELITQFQDKYYLQKRGLAMGVDCSPDLANLYGWHFERQSNILVDPQIPFYGRYIDDCFALVYASSREEAINVMQNKIKFDDCVIEWDASDHYQHFLDMTIYRDSSGKIQHMPYRKVGSHQERIPWISHHPLDVKRGTFIGEMSRLATLSSVKSHYVEAMKGLVSLYVKRGYPDHVVNTWLKANFTERWNKRLNENKREHAEVLVLKSEFNTAWNYFNAKELGDEMFTYWRTWMRLAESGSYNPAHPAFEFRDASIGETPDSLRSEIWYPDGTYRMPDIRKINIVNRRMIVSRKRTRNLFDLTSTWKKVVLKQLEEHASQDLEIVAGVEEDAPMEEGEVIVLHRRSLSPDRIDPNTFLVKKRRLE